MHTEAINHDPAVTFFQTGSQLAGRPSMGAWLSYGLGSESRRPAAFVVLVTGKGGAAALRPAVGLGLSAQRYQGVKFRSGRPGAVSVRPRRLQPRRAAAVLDDAGQAQPRCALSESATRRSTRIAQYEMAFRMQTSVPELTDISGRARATFELYGEDARKPGDVRRQLPAGAAAGRARRALHPALPPRLGPARQAAQGHQGAVPDDRPASAALVADLAERGLLDDTLVVWGGEFGRTVYCQGQVLTADRLRPRPSPALLHVWLAGGGVKPGVTWARPTTSPTTSSRTRCTSTTCTPRCCTSWASTTRGSPTASRGATSG
jgi:hypothetical protein